MPGKKYKHPSEKREDPLVLFTTKLLSAGKPEYIIPEALEILRKTLKADRSCVMEVIADQDGEPAWKYSFEANASDCESLMLRAELKCLPFRWFPFWESIHSEGVTINTSVSELPDAERDILLQHHLVSLLAVPYMKNGIYNGFIGFANCSKKRSWSEEDVQMVKTAADAIQMYFEKQALETQLWEKTEELEGFFTVAVDLLCIADFNGRFVRVNHAWETILGYSAALLEGRSLMEFVHPDDRQATIETIGELFNGKPVLNFTNRYLASDNTYKYIEWRSLPFRNKIYAAARDVTDRKIHEEKLLQLSVTDTLTSIYNRRYFTQRMEQEIYRSERFHSRFSLIMFDIDHFKSVNDRFGHKRGDAVLIYLTDLVRSRLRKTDLFARWGGEEFMIMLVNTPTDDAYAFAEELRTMVETSDFQEAGKVTISLGVTEFYEHDNVDIMIQRVDCLMYDAKNAGRNITIHD